MRYKNIETDYIYDTIDEVLEDCIDPDYHRDDDYFETWVNERYGSIDIYGETYWAYDILQEMSTYNLDNLRTDYCDECNDEDRDNIEDELADGEVGDRYDVHNYVIEILPDIDEEVTEESIEELRDRINQGKKMIEEQEMQDRIEADDLIKVITGA